VFLLIVSLYAAVWLACRPSGFSVSAEGLDVVFPAWTRSLSAASLLGAHAITSQAFREEFGWAMRIGVGGLGGGFGWLWTKRRGMLEFYVSRLDGLVLIERREGMPLLVTPEEPARMAAAVEAVCRSASS